MDTYTTKTKAWLNSRFAQKTVEGIYFAHQPIYGLRAGHSETGLLMRYTITYQILKALGRLNFSTLVDVGGAEGYKAFLARELLGVQVTNCDLSEEVCHRGKELFNIEGVTADIHHLPFSDGQFDVTLCSETLEHVTDYRQAINELLRVARKAVVISVPHDDPNKVEKIKQEEVIHGHINIFQKGSFNYLKQSGFNIIETTAYSPWMKLLLKIGDAEPERPEDYFWLRPLAHIYNLFVPIFRKVFCEKIVSQLIKLDAMVSRLTGTYGALVVIIIKDPECLRHHPKIVNPEKMLKTVIPYNPKY